MDRLCPIRWRRRRKILREISAGKAVTPVVTSFLEHIHDLPYLLVFQESPHELGARIFPHFIAFPAREKHLRLYANETRGHFEIIGGFVESEGLDAQEELLCNACDRNVLNIDLFITYQCEQQIERTGELRQLDDEDFAFAARDGCQVVH